MENETAKCVFAICSSEHYGTSDRRTRTELTQYSFMDSGDVKVHVTDIKFAKCDTDEDERTNHAYYILPKDWQVEKIGQAMFFKYKYNSIRKHIRISREAFVTLLDMEHQA